MIQGESEIADVPHASWCGVLRCIQRSWQSQHWASVRELLSSCSLFFFLNREVKLIEGCEAPQERGLVG